jgi:4-aminobutyrate aminotransferase-like enzyme
MSNAQPHSHKQLSLTNSEWQARKAAAIARGQGNVAPVYVERACNSEVWDVEGNRYVDFGTRSNMSMNLSGSVFSSSR